MVSPADSWCAAAADYDSIAAVNTAPDSTPAEIDALRAAWRRSSWRDVRRKHGPPAPRRWSPISMVAHLKLLIAKMKHDRFGASSERGRKLLDQMELELEELEAAASEDAAVTVCQRAPKFP